MADSLVSSAARKLPLRMRPDLSVRYHHYQGRPYWVIKEPVGLKYYRFQEEEYAILRKLDGSCSFEDIKNWFESEYAPQKITLQDLQHFIGMLHRSGLLITEAQGQGRQLKRRRDENFNKELMQKLSNVLAIRFKGIDPERLLNWLYPIIGFFFRWWFVAFVLTMGVGALALVGVNFEEFRAKLPAFHEFFGPENWLWLGITLGMTKVLHEFGHGLSCKHFGGECHEMGVMFLVLTPCLYCNVSDSWLLPSKWHRAAIGAAGMYVELFLATTATYLWWFSEPGLLNHICLSVMFICSVSTILFNGNPLLRFDGYYILSDLSEIPNLRQKSSKIMQRFMSEYCLGLEQQDDPFLPDRNQWFFALYTSAAVAYRWIVVISIMMFLNSVLEPYGLKALGQIIAGAGMFGMVVQPLWQLGKFMAVPGRMSQVKMKNVWITTALVAALIAFIVFVPLPYSVKCAVEVQPEDATAVYVRSPGEIDEVLIKVGDRVEVGTPIIRLKNEELQLSRVALEQQRDISLTRLKSYGRARFESPEYARRSQETQKALETAVEQLAMRMEDIDRLTIKATAAGVVLDPPHKPEQPENDAQLGTWSGSPLDAENLGARLEIQDVICRIGEPTKYEAILSFDQADQYEVREEQKALIRLDAYAGDTLEGVIKEVSRDRIQMASPSMSTQAGGTLATKTVEGGMQRPLSSTYQANVPLSNENDLLQIGLRGRAKIKADWKPLGSRLWRYLTQTFHFDL